MAELNTGSANTLDTLGDVTLTSLASGHVLYFNGSLWVNAVPNTAGLVDLTSSQTMTGQKLFSDDLVLNNQKAVLFRELTVNGTNFVGFKAPASLSADKVFTLPGADGSANQYLKTDGSGNLSFGAPAVAHLSDATNVALLAGRSGGAGNVGQLLKGSLDSAGHLRLESTNHATKGEVQIAGGSVLAARGTSGTAGQARFYNAADTFYVTLQAGAQAANHTYTLPTSLPSASGGPYFLSGTSGGVMSWQAAPGSAGGTITVAAADGIPSVTCDTLKFTEADGFTLGVAGAAVTITLTSVPVTKLATGTAGYDLGTTGSSVAWKEPEAVDYETWRIERKATDATKIQLTPLGNAKGKIAIANKVYTFTSAVEKNNSGLSASTAYYVYAYDSGGSVTLEIVTQAPTSEDPFTFASKQGDPSRRYLGKLRTNTSTQFDTEAVVSANARSFATREVLNDCRLSLHASDPDFEADITAATSVNLLPTFGNRISLYNSTSSLWETCYLTAAISVAIPSTTNTPFDVFAYSLGGKVVLECVSWANDSTRAQSIARQNGIFTKQGDPSRRYLGTGRTIGTSGQSQDTSGKRFLWNYYNRRTRRLFKLDQTAHTYATTTWRYFNNDSTNLVEWVSGMGVPVLAMISASLKGDGSGAQAVVAVLIDGASTFGLIAVTNAGSLISEFSAVGSEFTGQGKHQFEIKQSMTAVATGTFNEAALVATLEM